jgi:TolB protein
VKRLAFAVFAGWMLLLVRSAAAQGEVPVVITRGSSEPYKVAVQRFEADMNSAAGAEQFYADLSSGLSFNAGFQAMDSAAFLEPTATASFQNIAINCDGWRAIGANILVQGLLERSGARQRAQFRVWDIDRCSLQGDAGQIEGPAEDAWLLARRVADDIVKRFTGVRGVSSTQLAVISDESGNKELYVMESDGSRRRKITRNGKINLFPDWSPDGSELIYTTYLGSIPEMRVVRRGNQPGGNLINGLAEEFKGSERLRAVFGPSAGWVTLVMTHNANTDIYLAKREGGQLQRLTEEPSIEVSPTWSPDRKRLAFASDRSGSQQIYVREMDSGLVRRLTYKGNYNATPSWSPTGEWIAFAARTGNTLDLYLIDPDSGYTQPLVIHERTDEGPTWSPDGRKIAFTSDRRGRREVYTIDIDGRNLRRLTQDFGNSSNPAWATWLD